MSRYIDAEWLSKLFPDTGEGDWTYNATALAYIDSAPSIDIVRCEECKHENSCEHQVLLSTMWNEVEDTADIEYCSYGERRE